MAAEDPPGSPPSKRRKLDLDFAADTGCTPPPTTESDAPNVKAFNHKSLDRPISPPLSRRIRSRTPTPSTPRVEADSHVTKQTSPAPTAGPTSTTIKDPTKTTKYSKSPVQLTKIRDLAPHQNVDTVELKDILGDPMIKECWNFNFLFDLDFVMEQFDPDVKNLVKVKIVHGFWKREDARRISLMEDAERYPNVETFKAYIPDPFGTHHSKMLVLFRHDDLAQVVIHTANMIPRDWGNMTQAVWSSPLLPLQPSTSTPADSQAENQAYPIGSGERIKTDLLRYLGAYDKKLSALTQQLVKYDFSSIRAAFVGSAPSRQKPTAADPSKHTSFGWLGLKEILSAIPVSNPPSSSRPNVVVQVSSIATLGQNPNWLTHFQSVLSHSLTPLKQPSGASNFFTKKASVPKSKLKKPDPTLNIIFPTPDEVRTSLDGYNSGGSIHTKMGTQSAPQQKQLDYFRPLLCHWKYSENLLSLPNPSPNVPRREAYRGPAAPHIKTYIRFSDADRKSIDWAMVTSANLSKQAWGELENKKEEVWIQSWETGVVIWPELFKDTDGTEKSVTMVPVFGKDMPEPGDDVTNEGAGIVDEVQEKEKEQKRIVAGFRMPYDLPLVPYGADEVPWCATLPYSEPDWKGISWPGY